MGEEQLSYAAGIASKLRRSGVSTMLDSEPASLTKRLGYADKMGFPYAVVIGGNEVTDKTVSLRDMRQGTNQTIPETELYSRF